MISHWPQIVYISLMSANLAINLLMIGKPRSGKYEFHPVLIAAIIQATLLYFGGFWK